MTTLLDDMGTVLTTELSRDRILDHYIHFTPRQGATRQEGFCKRFIHFADQDFQNHFIIVDPNHGWVSFVPESTMIVTKIEEDKVSSALINQIASLAYERRQAATQAHLRGKELSEKSFELRELEGKIVKAFEEADRRGYCSEVKEVARVAGIEVPEEKQYAIEVEATIRLTVYVNAYSEESAKKKIETQDISSAISGEDSIESWSVI